MSMYILSFRRLKLDTLDVYKLYTSELKCLYVPNVFDFFVHKTTSFWLKDGPIAFLIYIFFVENFERILIVIFLQMSFSCFQLIIMLKKVSIGTFTKIFVACFSEHPLKNIHILIYPCAKVQTSRTNSRPNVITEYRVLDRRDIFSPRIRRFDGQRTAFPSHCNGFQTAFNITCSFFPIFSHNPISVRY
jgi:hypothetical protein